MASNPDKTNSALNQGVRLSEALFWSSYDFANSGYTTVVLTTVYNAFFVSVVAEGKVWATFAWTLAVTLSNLFSIFVVPAIGALADAKGDKRFWLAVTTWVCVISTAALFFTGKGTIVLAGILIIISNTAFNAGVALNSAFLPELAKPDSLGKVSGWGWSFGYLGGIVSLALCLAVVFLSKDKGYGAERYVPYCMVLTAFLFLVVAQPMLLFVKERAKPSGKSLSGSIGKLFLDSKANFQFLKQEKDFLKFCLCGVLYQAGIAVVITLSAVYAELEMKFTTSETISLILIVNFTAALGAFAFGYLQDLMGHKRTLALTILLWIVMALLAAVSTDKITFWIAANLAGIAMGSSQSAGRAIVAVFAPSGSTARYYSAWNVAVWLANILGPITYGAVTWMTQGNQRIAISVISLYFIFGLLVLWKIKLPTQSGQ